MQKTSKRTLYIIIFIVAASLLGRIAAGLFYYNTFDTFWYRGWAVDLPNGLFSAYSRAEELALDYPPLYLFCLYLTGLAYRLFGTDSSNMMQMFLLKFWPVFFDTVCVCVLYRTCRKYGDHMAIAAAALWAFNPSVIFNTAFWGQTDQLMALLLLLAFDRVYCDRAVSGCALFAVAGLTKFQSLFFTPMLLLELYYRCGIKKLLKGIGVAACTVLAVFLPFMIGSSDPLLFFRVYLGGAGQYKCCTLNAYNLYGLLGLNWVSDENPVFAGMSVSQISLATTALVLILLVLTYIYSKRRNVYVACFAFMECIFILTSRMHERYQIIVLPFALMAYITTKRENFSRQFGLLTIVTLINQALLLFLNNKPEIFYAPYYERILQIMSAVNILIFIYVIYECCVYFFAREEE